jgi:hypothetical protein
MRSPLYFIFLLSIVTLLSCNHDYEPVFDENSDSRIAADLNEYSALLQSVPYGWKAALYTGEGAGYFYYFDFNENGKVVMLSDFNETTATEVASGTWRLKALQRTTLTFDTYSYIHLPADPDGNVNGGNNGQGLLSDFEFTFTEVSDDTLKLKGLRYNTELVLVKATETETQHFLDSEIASMLSLTKEYVEINKGLQLQLPGERIASVAIDVTKKIFAVQYVADSKDSIQTFISPFSFTLDGIALKSPLVVGNFRANRLDWNADNQMYTISLDRQTELKNSIEALVLRPTNPLVNKIGDKYKTVLIPENPSVNTVAGQSGDFIEAYNEAAYSLLEGPLKLTLHEMAFTVDKVNKQIYYDVYISRTADDNVTRRYLAQYIYDYTVNADGSIDLTPNLTNENGSTIALDMRKILQRLDDDSFKLEYIAGGFQLIAGFYSQQQPDFTFAGYLTP